MMFAVSLLLLLWSSQRVASRVATDPGDRYWVFIGCAMLHLGTVATLASLIHRLLPQPWLLGQLLICALTFKITGGIGWPGLSGLLPIWRQVRAAVASWTSELTPWALIALLVISASLVLSAITQAATPIQGFDEKMYHASRVLYWIQHQTVLPFETHNIRQTMVPFGSELFFLWPVLLTKSELLGRLVFWTAYPLAALGQYLLMRRMSVSRTAALVGVLILLCTPLVMSSAIGLKPELWSVVALLGLAYWAVTIGSAAGGQRMPYFLLGIFAVLCINIRSFPVVTLPSLVLIAWWAGDSLSLATRLKTISAGLACPALLSTLMIPLVANTFLYHHPLGPKAVRDIVEADFTPRTMYTHAVRFAALLAELPDVPASADTRAAISKAANESIAALGADTPLKWEDDHPWPGRFAYSLPESSKRFSLAGLLWLPVLFMAMAALVGNIATTWRQVRLTPVSALALLAIPLLAAILFGARWMVQSEVPGRFLVGPYPLFLSMGVAMLSLRLASRRWTLAIAALLVIYSAYQPIRAQAYDAVKAATNPVSGKAINEPFEEAIDLMPAGSRILLIGHQDAADYPLFSPASQYSNVVIPWGTSPFDPARMRHLIDSEKITHVLVQDDEHVSFHWFPAIDTRDMVRWLASDSGLKDVSLNVPKMRLFATSGSGRMNERAFQTHAMPSTTPLIRVGASLHGEVGIDPTLLVTPWPVESLAGAESGFLWVGQGYGEGVEFGLWSRQERTVDLRFEVSPGPSLPTPERSVMLLHDGVPVGTERPFRGASSVAFAATLHAGRNVFSFYSQDSATVKSMPNGDTRHLLANLGAIRVEQPPAASPGASPGSRHTGTGDLARSARRAVGLISRRQEVDGYWLTSYTSGKSYLQPTAEMNTYVTSLMVDILAAKAVTGLTGSLARARSHLRNQIEAGGLVRYHGRPDGPAMGLLNLCPITPDADDTALVWRIAPDTTRQAMRDSALSRLKEFRTPEGLYKTWLDQPRDYRCIDPGSDPNPADAGIQMHVLMMLAEADRRAADALCVALGKVIDQDRVWVYYGKAPLVPLLRLADLRAAGCNLPLPPIRLQTDVSSQEIWLDTIRMLQRLEANDRQPPAAASVLALLRQLAADDFASIRQNPPLLYHNDLTASVRRFYWSEDVGYALWLRLHSEAARRGLLNGDS
jgi:hypothetical protein